MAEFGCSELSSFVGSCYLFNRSKVASDIFAFARSVLPHYEELGILPLPGKGLRNEEPLFSIAMGACGIRCEPKGSSPVIDVSKIDYTKIDISNAFKRLGCGDRFVKPILHFHAFKESRKYLMCQRRLLGRAFDRDGNISVSGRLSCDFVSFLRYMGNRVSRVKKRLT